MKLHRFHISIPVARWLLLALAALTLVSRAPAQPQQEERWLLVFDTASAMKKRLPAVESAVKDVLSSSVNGRMHAGDSVGIWTFDQQLHTGQVPLLIWNPAGAAGTASNLVTFLRKQRYSGLTSFAPLQPMLNQVIENSARLTVVIVCDGQGEITWTPYNDGINQAFRKSADERSKLRQPVLLVLRTQRGEYVGSSVNFPPGALNVPAFPPLPQEINPIPTNPPPPVLPVVKPRPVPPLIIIGTKTPPVVKPATNEPVKPMVAPNPPAPPSVAVETNSATSNPVAPVKPVILVPPPPAPATNNPATNLPVAVVLLVPAPPAPATNPPELEVLVTNPVVTNLMARTATPTNEVAGPANPNPAGFRIWLVLGAAAVAVLLVLVVMVVGRSRQRSQSSLITSSMSQDRRPPPRN